jgi:hypothetical protein
MRKLIVVLSYLLFAGQVHAQKSVSRPKIVVGVVIDQMRWDYLYRYYNLLSDGGFKRLMKDGFNCQNTTINYIPSFTAPGHTCIYTGSVPAIHGIVGNDFVDNFTCDSLYCVTDYSVHLTNSVDSLSGSMSPKNVLTTTITDELRLATNFNSRVYGVAIKDRGSIIPAGHLANGAYWFDEKTGNFVSSSYYSNTSPVWLTAFNKRRTADSLLNLGWKLMLPANKYTQSTADANKYEGPFKGESAPVFPHMFTTLSGKDKYHALLSTPSGNSMTSQVAFACMDGEQLGNRGNTDFLCISMSSTDYVGHQFGPNSMEAEDIYLRLDKELANLMKGLDARYGKGNYLFFLTADHGAAHNAQYLKDQKVPAGFLSNKIKANLNKKLRKQFGEDSLVTHFINYEVYVNEKQIADNDLDRKKIKKAITEFFYSMPEIEFVVDLENINQTALPEPLRAMVINGYYRGRSGDIEVIPNPGWFSGYGVTGTTHGTWHPYDTHIPLLWYGWNVKAGETYATVNMTDISATIAAMLHIQMPNGCVGKPITEIVGKNK